MTDTTKPRPLKRDSQRISTVDTRVAKPVEPADGVRSSSQDFDKLTAWLDNWSVPEPSALSTEAHREVVLIVYRLFARAGDWPGFEEVDYEVDGSGLGDAWTLMQHLPLDFITGTDLRTPPSPRQPLGLRIAGMAAAGEQIDGAATDFLAFYESVMLAVEVADETPPPAAPTLQASEIHRRVELPATDRSGVLARIGRQRSERRRPPTRRACPVRPHARATIRGSVPCRRATPRGVRRGTGVVRVAARRSR